MAIPYATNAHFFSKCRPMNIRLKNITANLHKTSPLREAKRLGNMNSAKPWQCQWMSIFTIAAAINGAAGDVPGLGAAGSFGLLSPDLQPTC